MPRKINAQNEEKPLCHIHDEVVNSDAIDVRKYVCVKESDFHLTKHTDGKHYCLFHLPTREKDVEKFEQLFALRLAAVEDKIASAEKRGKSDETSKTGRIIYDFRYVWFPSTVDLSNYIFEVEANFNGAVFAGWANFMLSSFSATANFVKASFMANASFYEVTFEKKAPAYFEFANFSAIADFNSATFWAGAYFNSAIFDEKSRLSFIETKFYDILDFNNTNFKGYVEFEGKKGNRLFVGKKTFINLQKTRIDDGKKIYFHIIRLEPSWFVDTDASDFRFTDCDLKYADGNRLDVRTELKNLKKRGFETANKLLTKACWQLAHNHEEMKSFPKASLFRQMANESKRLEDYNGWKIWSWHWWYWLTSFYGESPLRAGLVLFGILLFFAIAFMLTDFQICPIIKTIPETPCTARTLNFFEAALQSLATATFQNIEYIKPNSMVTTFLIILEKILAPLQAALLALAIRRKFMR